ncbi:hypothetical protein SDC9_164595 [bioreactor metagenome]|uniref:Uncharacterized protein n=1 Tax=bioreactor metagenome TaxID=1076179 RepID=A0A645FZE4_9ZZZZ
MLEKEPVISAIKIIAVMGVLTTAVKYPAVAKMTKLLI